MRRTWTWTFDLPPAELWPVLADTNRFNEAMGLPPYVLDETPQANGTILRRGSGKAAGFQLEWEEKPYEWIAGRHFRQARCKPCRASSSIPATPRFATGSAPPGRSNISISAGWTTSPAIARQQERARV